jgi:Uma2 family endonuclease
MVTAIALPRPMTYAEYAALPEDGRRYELINGELIMAAAPNGKHLLASKRFHDGLNAFVEAGELGLVFYAPYEIPLANSVLSARGCDTWGLPERQPVEVPRVLAA